MAPSRQLLPNWRPRRRHRGRRLPEHPSQPARRHLHPGCDRRARRCHRRARRQDQEAVEEDKGGETGGRVGRC